MATPSAVAGQGQVAGATDDGCRVRDEAPRDDPIEIAGRREHVLHDVGDHLVGKLGERRHGQLSRRRVGAGEHPEGPPAVQRIRETGNGACRDLGGGATSRGVERGVDLGRIAVVEQFQQATLGVGTEVGLVERDGEREVGILTAQDGPRPLGRSLGVELGERHQREEAGGPREFGPVQHGFDVACCAAVTGPGNGPERQLHDVGAPVPDQTRQQLVCAVAQR